MVCIEIPYEMKIVIKPWIYFYASDCNKVLSINHVYISQDADALILLQKFNIEHDSLNVNISDVRHSLWRCVRISGHNDYDHTPTHRYSKLIGA